MYDVCMGDVCMGESVKHWNDPSLFSVIFLRGLQTYLSKQEVVRNHDSCLL